VNRDGEGTPLSAAEEYDLAQHYCPHRVSFYLRAYSVLLSQRREHERQGGKPSRPAHLVAEEQWTKRADVAGALADLYRRAPKFATTIARLHGLAYQDGDFVPSRAADVTDLARRMVRPELVAGNARLARRTEAQAKRLVREMREEGLIALAMSLGWRPDDEAEGGCSHRCPKRNQRR
jgi:hypothetical protein